MALLEGMRVLNVKRRIESSRTLGLLWSLPLSHLPQAVMIAARKLDKV